MRHDNIAPKSDLPQGTLDLLILKIVTLGPIHGYAIAQRIQQISRDVVQVQQGSLYPALHRLENKGLLAAEWKDSETGREAKFYRLTARGRRQLREETESWARKEICLELVAAPPQPYTGRSAIGRRAPLRFRPARGREHPRRNERIRSP